MADNAGGLADFSRNPIAGVKRYWAEATPGSVLLDTATVAFTFWAPSRLAAPVRGKIDNFVKDRKDWTSRGPRRERDEGTNSPTTVDMSERRPRHEEQTTDVAANTGPRVWTNLAPKDPLFPGRTVPLDRLSSVNGRFQYVVGQDGRPIVGRGGHIDLARGDGVTAAGEVRVVNGEVRMFNNASGHYRPDASIQGIAQTAFENAGLIIRNGAWQAVTH